MAEELRWPADAQYRERIRQRGFESVRSRFRTSRVMDENVSLHQEPAGQSWRRRLRLAALLPFAA